MKPVNKVHGDRLANIVDAELAKPLQNRNKPLKLEILAYDSIFWSPVGHFRSSRLPLNKELS
jgi:hypothetical protein